MTETAIQVENLSKRYRIGVKEESPDTLGGALISLMRSPGRQLNRLRQLTNFDEIGTAEDTIWALRDVSFEVKHGEILGIIGRNGAGKSTLLKILARITEPTSGRALVSGRVASLLEVGTGFHPDLTGRENVYLNGTILGMRKTSIDKQFDEIIAFAEVEKFVDTPVKRYSSGMRVRLAFAVAAHLEPEILLIDEVLAVGDVAFQRKCLGKMNAVAKGGRTIFFVSHQIGAIQSLCTRAIMLEEGSVLFDGDVEDVVGRYLGGSESSGRCLKEWDIDSAPGDAVARLVRLRSRDQSGITKDRFDVREAIHLEMEYVVLSATEYQLSPNFRLFESMGGPLFISGQGPDSTEVTMEIGGTYTSTCTIPPDLMNEGHYTVTAALSTSEQRKEHFFEEQGIIFEVTDALKPGGARHPGYSGRYPGAIRPLLNWHTRRTR
jgi:lipopolysaccharide transport system ATP-binding protein